MADKKKILDYLSQSVKEYSVGVDLIAEFGSPSMAAIYRRGSPRFMMPQVLAILRRMARSASPAPEPNKPLHSQKSLPKAIADAKVLLHILYLSMVDYHKQLLAMGDDNSPERCQQRVNLMKKRAPYIDCFVELNHLVDDYFATDKISDRLVELVGIHNGQPLDKPNTSHSLQQFSDLDLAKEYKRTKSNINRRINKLRFQSTRKQPQLNPMPDSPARRKVVAELSECKAYLKAIMQEQRNRGLIN